MPYCYSDYGVILTQKEAFEFALIKKRENNPEEAEEFTFEEFTNCLSDYCDECGLIYAPDLNGAVYQINALGYDEEPVQVDDMSVDGMSEYGFDIIFIPFPKQISLFEKTFKDYEDMLAWAENVSCGVIDDDIKYRIGHIYACMADYN